MKKLLILLAVLAILPAASAMADPIAIGDQVKVLVADPTYSNGGPFVVQTLGGTNLFQTFCVESETFTPGETLTVQRIDTLIVRGGVASPGRALPPEVAYLYTKWRGIYGLLGGMGAADGPDYQAAIWYFVGLAGGLDNTLAVEAANAVSTGAWTGLGDVRVLGFDDGYDNTYRKQDMLTMTPVPEPGSMLLLGTGLIGLAGAVRRRMRK